MNDIETVGRLRARLDDVRALVESGHTCLDPDDVRSALEGMGDDDGHGPWFDMGGAVLCSCRYPVDKDERCTRPRHLQGQHDALAGALFEAVGELMARFDRGPDQVDMDEGCVADLQAAYDALAAWGEQNADAIAGGMTS